MNFLFKTYLLNRFFQELAKIIKKFTCIPAIAMPRNTNVKLSHCSQFVTFPRQP